MKKLAVLTAIAALTAGATIASAQDMTLDGAKVMITEIPGASDCQNPGATPLIPDGATTAEPAMLDAIDAVKAFIASSETYRNCLDEAAAAAGDAVTEEQNKAVTMVYNSNVEVVEKLGEDVNAEIREFKAANPEE